MDQVRERTRGVSYYMYAESKHVVAHIHAYCNGRPPHPEFAASIAIESLEVLAGQLPPKQEREAKAWIQANRDELLKMWKNRSKPGGIYKIKD